MAPLSGPHLESVLLQSHYSHHEMDLNAFWKICERFKGTSTYQCVCINRFFSMSLCFKGNARLMLVRNAACIVARVEREIATSSLVSSTCKW